MTPLLHHRLPCCGRRPHIPAMKRVEGASIEIGCDCRGYNLHYVGYVRRSPTGRALMVEWVER